MTAERILVLAFAAFAAMVALDPRPESTAALARSAGIEFGVAVSSDTLRQHGERIAETFTSLTPENAMKWRSLEPEPGSLATEEADAIAAFAAARGLRLRGHALMWSRMNGSPKWLPEMLREAEDSAAELSALIAKHIDRTVERYRGRVEQWDVLNEPLALRGAAPDAQNPFLTLLDEQGLKAAFETAASADPGALLFVNEISLEASDARFDALLALVDRLRAAGAPIHGVGLQGHFFGAPPSGERLARRFARIGEAGLVSEITELDIPLWLFAEAEDPLLAQADAFGVVVAACVAAPACHGVTVWGLSDARSWMGPEARPLLFDDAMRAKPALAAVRRALRAGARISVPRTEPVAG